jgi:hypothetical protein
LIRVDNNSCIEYVDIAVGFRVGYSYSIEIRLKAIKVIVSSRFLGLIDHHGRRRDAPRPPSRIAASRIKNRKRLSVVQVPE